MDLSKRILASIILAAVGDAIGFYGGNWEFNYNGENIYNELKKTFGKVEKIPIVDFPISDDTIMHKGTIKALSLPYDNSLDKLMKNFVKYYDHYWQKEMSFARSPGPTCRNGLRYSKIHGWDSLPYDSRGGGCGGSMRAMAIGLKYYKTTKQDNKNIEKDEENEKKNDDKNDDLDWLVKVSIESGRITHNHCTGYLGAMVSALFNSYALLKIPPKRWGYLLMKEAFPRAKKYLFKESKRESNLKDFEAFVKKCEAFFKKRNVLDGKSDPIFPKIYGFKERDEQYKALSFSGWGGASGDDSVLIAYDAFLGANGDWTELIYRGAIHGGDSDSTATICCGWFGSFYGLENVPKSNYDKIETKKDLISLSDNLLKSMKLSK